MTPITITSAASGITTEFTRQILDVTFCTQAVALQDKAINALPPKDQAFLIRKNEEHFMKFLSGPYAMLGILDDRDQLIAQMQIAYVAPEDPDKNLTRCHQLDDVMDWALPYTVIEGVAVDPDWWNKGLMQKMVASAIELSHKEYQCGNFFTEVAVGNQASYRGFEKNGFGIFVVGADPSDDCPLWYMHYTHEKARP